MSSLIAVPAAPQSPENTTVAFDGWYPEIDCNETRKILRLGDIVTHARLADALIGGMIAVGNELRAWRAVQEAAGYASIEAVPPFQELNGENRLKLLFIRAARYSAAALLAELHRDVTAGKEGQSRGDVQLLSASDYRREATWAIRDILGVPRTAVELI